MAGCWRVGIGAITGAGEKVEDAGSEERVFRGCAQVAGQTMERESRLEDGDESERGGP